MTHIKCPKCPCRFGTRIDLGHHLQAHLDYGDDLPSVKGKYAKYKKVDRGPSDYERWFKK